MEVEVEAKSLKKIQFRLFIIILIRRDILQENAQSLQGQKTNIGLANLRINN